MSFASLPIEMVTQIIDSLDESDPEMPFEVKKHREMSRALMALRLTCKALDKIATRQLFRTFCLSPSLKSWLNLCNIAALERFRVNLQTLALERHDKGTYNYKWRMKVTSASPEYGFLDLSLLPKLRILKAEDKWLITRRPRSNIKIPRGRCKIHAMSFAECEPAIWSVLGDLERIVRYGFEISSVNCYLGASGPWATLLNLDLSGLKYLRLCSNGYYSNQCKRNLYPDSKLLAKLERLPNLEEFHLSQYFFGRENPNPPKVNLSTNVLRYLLAKKWPRLRYLDLRYLSTTVADFQAFVAPHAGTLTTFQMHSGLICPRVTEEEKLQRFYLPHWIRTVVCPRGGGTEFEHFFGQPEGSYEAPEDIEDKDIIMEDYEGDVELEDFEKDVEGDIMMADVHKTTE
ncbi:hypothetical protein MMC31_004917 [Peltigera leucophlebia]|nr:hypothetical protein [Peltigera leucophlebia]